MRTFLLCSLCFFSLSLHGQTTSRPLTEATYRAGMPHFFAKLNRKQPTKIAYLGGSITRADSGWRDQTLRWFQRQYPAAPIEQVMAAIGGTGSDFGAHRLGTHVLRYQPDVVFVEFAVNDHDRSFEAEVESIEGIVRQIWKHNPQTDICLVYTLFKPQLETYQQGKFPVSASAMETVADHYRIPSVSMGVPVAQLISAGKMVIQGKRGDSTGSLVFSEDGVHPFVETGQKIYAETLEKHLTAMASVGKRTNRRLPDALTSTNLENATLHTVDRVEKSQGWQRVDSVVTGKPYAALMPPVWASADTTDYLRFRVKGPAFGIVDVVGPSSGQIIVQIDNDPPRLINRFDQYCSYYRMYYSMVTGLSPGEHTITIRPSARRPDKAGLLRKKNIAITDPRPYEPLAFYIGGILVRQ